MSVLYSKQEQRVTWEHSGVYVDPCGQVFPSSRTNSQSFYSHLPGHTHGPGNSHDSQHASGPGHASGSGQKHNHTYGHQHSQGARGMTWSGGVPGATPGSHITTATVMLGVLAATTTVLLPPQSIPSSPRYNQLLPSLTVESSPFS